jgi:hypothetical protein
MHCNLCSVLLPHRTHTDELLTDLIGGASYLQKVHIGARCWLMPFIPTHTHRHTHTHTHTQVGMPQAVSGAAAPAVVLGAALWGIGHTEGCRRQENMPQRSSCGMFVNLDLGHEMDIDCVDRSYFSQVRPVRMPRCCQGVEGSKPRDGALRSLVHPHRLSRLL